MYWPLGLDWTGGSPLVAVRDQPQNWKCHLSGSENSLHTSCQILQKQEVTHSGNPIQPSADVTDKCDQERWFYQKLHWPLISRCRHWSTSFWQYWTSAFRFFSSSYPLLYCCLRSLSLLISRNSSSLIITSPSSLYWGPVKQKGGLKHQSNCFISINTTCVSCTCS